MWGRQVTARATSTLVVRGATVWHPGGTAREDLHVSGGRFSAAPAAPDAEVLDARGGTAVPLVVDTALARVPQDRRDAYDLTPGNPATFAVVRGPVRGSRIRSVLVVRPDDLVGVWVAGHAEARDGVPTRALGRDLTEPTVRSSWVGTWWDRRRGMAQHLHADGRYAETRGGRANAFTGRYWVRQERITYLDDQGFWAFGELLDGVLHHAGFILERA